MRLKDVFIIEGAQDAEFRAQAQQSFDTLRKNLNNSPAAAWLPEKLVRKVHNKDTSWQFGPPITNGLPQDLDIHFALVPQGEGFSEATYARRVPPKTGGVMFIFFELPPQKYQEVLRDPGKAKEVARLNAVRMLDKVRRQFIHEYMHYIDRSRTKGTVEPSSLARQRGQTDYYKHPLEMNAYIQEMSDEVEQAVKRDPKVLGRSVTEFYKNFISITKRANPAFYAYIRQRNVPKLKKRIAQLYNDLKDKTSG
jgi:hypothetical protein